MTERGKSGNGDEVQRQDAVRQGADADPNALDKDSLAVPADWTKEWGGDPQITGHVTRHAFRIVADELGLADPQDPGPEA